MRYDTGASPSDAYYEPPLGPGDCPECGAAVSEDTRERTVECTECPWSDGYDWDAAAELRAEVRAGFWEPA